MKLRRIVFAFIVICMLMGLLAGFFSHSLEAALTVPLKIGTSRPTSTPSKMGPGGPVGTSTDGRQWNGDANSIEVFSVVSGTGQIDQAQGTFNAILGPTMTNTEIVFSGIVNQFAQGATVNVGAVLRWTDANNWYKALIDGSKLQILRRVSGKTTSLGSFPLNAKGGTSYTLRFRAVGASLFVKAWQSNQPEPNGWMLNVMDTALSKGSGGLRFLMQNGVVIKVTSFRETTVAGMI